VLNDMLGGHVDLFFGNVSAALALWRDQKVKVLAVLDKNPSPAMPGVPPITEAGLPELLSVGWFAVAGPPKMAPALRDRIASDFIEALKLPDVQAKYRALSVEPVAGTPAETAAFIKDEARRWTDVIKKTGVVVD
jgi:tripartite-type tricarboxylate transporter receptor subunit TctC